MAAVLVRIAEAGNTLKLAHEDIDPMQDRFLIAALERAE
jgi:hypothetical protein